VLLLCTLLSSALIEVDGNRPPLRLFVPALIVGIAVPLIWPIDRLNVLAGLAAGVIAGGAVWFVALAWMKKRGRNAADVALPGVGLSLGLICAGPLLGWLALAAVAVVSVAVYALLRFGGRRGPQIHVPPSVWLLIATLSWLLVPWAQ
jgi:hypothetical protein